MVDRVSSFSQTNTTLSQILRLEAKYGDATNEQSSGLKATNFAGISGDSQNLLNLQSQQSTLTTQTANANLTINKINTISGALGSISDNIASALSGLSTAIYNSNFTGVAASGQAQLQASLTSISGFLNSQYSGNYLFGGNVTDRAPVNTSASGYTSLNISTPNTSYYQGDDAVQSIQVDDSVKVSYGITADNPAFEQALRAISTALANPSDQNTLKQAYTLLSQAADGVGGLQSQIAAQSSAVTSQVSANTTILSYLGQNISDITNADVTQVSTDLANLKNQLDASYSALANILKLRLSDYLK